MQEGNTLEEDYEFGDLREGRRYKRKKNRVGREDPHSEPEVWEPCAQVQIVEIPYNGGGEEDCQSSPVIEELVSPTQTGSCIESMTPCVSPQL
jgi:hypothetical protein